MSTKFDYKTVNIGDIQLETVEFRDLDEAQRQFLTASGGALLVHGGTRVKSVIIDGQPYTPTGRFWESLYSRFGLNNSFFKYFTHNELFKRVSERGGSVSKIRITTETSNEGSMLLAATSPTKPVVVYDDLLEILQSFGNGDENSVKYHNGVVVSTHSPRIGDSPFEISGDKFSNKFELHCPVDGYGSPSVYLSLLRWICSNGAVGFANAFKTSLTLGSGSDDVKFALERALSAFANDEGYAMMRSRFEMASQSWASVREQQELYKLLLNLQSDKVLQNTVKDWKRASADDLSIGVTNTLLKAYDRCTGNPHDIYRFEPQLMSDKKQRTLPVSCRVYDMINFATELATHHVSEEGSRQLQAWVGHMITNDFDLEGSADTFQNWKDLFLSDAFKPKPKV